MNKQDFYEKTRFPGIIGCVDGTHVKIIPPSNEERHLFLNRKGLHSLNVMLVCDCKMIITYVDATNPGASHDSFIWQGSALDQHLMRNYQDNGTRTWILGDAGYPLKPYLITPFRNTVPRSREAKFIELHAKARNVVERTIGVLKNSSRCILGARQLHYSKNKAKQIINSCCAIHNLRIKFNIHLDELLIVDENQTENDDNFSTEETTNEAERIRNEIMNCLTLYFILHLNKKKYQFI